MAIFDPFSRGSETSSTCLRLSKGLFTGLFGPVEDRSKRVLRPSKRRSKMTILVIFDLFVKVEDSDLRLSKKVLLQDLLEVEYGGLRPQKRPKWPFWPFLKTGNPF